MMEEPAVLNPARFAQMARGDSAGLMEIAGDFFKETRRLMPAWMALLEAGDYRRLREELHRCKSGASIFGLERIMAMLIDAESPMVLEIRGFDVAAFERELGAAEGALAAMGKPAA